MPRFEVFAGEALIGHSELESGDAPMGTAGGKFLPSPAYTAIQAAVVAARDGSQDHLSLAVRVAGGPELPAQGGVRILDYSTELGIEGFMVEVQGIGYPLYGELFPEHVTAYKTQFSRRP